MSFWIGRCLETMNACEFLNSVRVLDSRIRMKMNQVASLRDSLTSPASPFGQEKVSGSKNVGAMGNSVALIIDIDKDIERLREELAMRQKEILYLLDQIKPEYAGVLFSYYIEGKSTKEIGTSRFLSRRQIQRLLKAGTVQFQSALDKHYASM